MDAYFYFVDYAKEKKISVALVAGDFFDGENVSFATVKKVADKMALCKDTMFFIAAGNHDFAGSNSFYRLFEWPRNVVIFEEGSKRFPFEDMNLEITGFGFSSPYQRESALENLTPADKSKINILLMHGDLNMKNSQFNPMMTTDIQKSGFDFIASGHIHKRSGLLKFQDTYFLYPGSLSAGGFDEQGTHGFYELEIEKGYIKENFVEIPGREYKEIAVDISGAFSSEEVVSCIKTAILDDNSDNIFKIILKGEKNGDFAIPFTKLSKDLEGVAFDFRILDETTEKIDYLEKRAELSLKGYFVRSLAELLEEETDERERKIRELALKLGCRALSNEGVDENEV